MKRYFGFLVFGLAVLFVLGASSSVSAVPDPASTKTEVAKWEQSKKWDALGKIYDHFELVKDPNDKERIICAVSVHTTDKESPFSVHGSSWVNLYGIHLRQLTTGWTWITEEVKMESGKVVEREVRPERKYIQDAGLPRINGVFSPFFTHCSPMRGGLPKETSEIIAKFKP
ncbi:MAG: hypothetical protein HYY92_01075 [Parcubacteria group bacterium]|nr:hypothetical protein [Parcubacteria group bacterium]